MCGLIGIVDTAEASANAVEGLYSQQHRGREAAGIASADGMGVHLQGGLGLVADVFPEERDVPRELPGTLAIGQVRYSTVPKDTRNSAVYQPLRGVYGNEPFCLAHNGNLTNTDELRERIGMERGTSIIDTELVVRLIELQHSSFFVRDLCLVLGLLRGSYSLLILFRDKLFAVRDPSGCRPLSIGESERMLVVASETCAFETLDVRRVADIEPGTIVQISPTREQIIVRFAKSREKKCAFEPVYFSHHTGDTFGIPLMDFRLRLGEALENECPANADIVLGVPDSAVVLAKGYGTSGKSGLYVPALTRHHHAGGRTFILPSQDQREAAVRRKFQCSRSAIEDKRVALIDDSVVRGTTMKILVRRIRKAGAKEVHVRSAFPPIRYSCLYGIDTPDPKKLIAANYSIDETRQFIGADSLAYLSEKTLLRVLGDAPASWCMACVTGKYWHNDIAA
ncbi:MAG: amidophosphoribosyltransferase [bacterium]|nr:amidophosphoribosyltransferase [bacterium]